MCNGNCNQGRCCDCAPDQPLSPAEAWFFIVTMLLGAIVSITGIAAIAGYVWGWLTR